MYIFLHDINYNNLLATVLKPFEMSNSVQQMEEGVGPGVVAAAGELSQEEEGELGPQALVAVGPTVF